MAYFLRRRIEKYRMLKKILILFVIIIAIPLLIFIAGVTGFLFKIWPTFINNQVVEISDEKVILLKNLLKESKFHEDYSIPYPGAQNELFRLDGEGKMNLLISGIILNKNRINRKSQVLILVKHNLFLYEHFDSEDCDMVCEYIERILKILEIENSSELLNVWRYGFPYNWMYKNL